MPAPGQIRSKKTGNQAQTSPQIGGLVHDINNLLTVITAHLTLLAEQDRAPAQASLAAARSAGALLRLLAPQAKPHIVSLDANEVARELLALLAPLLGDAVKLEAKLAPQRLMLRADRAQLLSALLNLALNARDAMPDGGSLRIASQRQAQHIVLEVSDTGHGMSKAVQARAGRRGFTTKAGGSGLGLRQVKDFARAARGKFAIASRPGGGAVATLLLPRSTSGG